MGKFALLAALLVASAGASAGALKNPDTSGETHGDEVVFEIHDQQLIGLPHSTEHRKGIFVSDDDPARHVGAPNAPKPPKPHEREHPKSGELWHPGPKFTNLTIYQVLSADEHYSKLVRLINYDEDYVSLLNDTSHNITFFAPNNHALTFPKHKKDRKCPHQPHDELATLYEQFESLTDDSEKKKKILHAILQYHTLHKKVIRPALYFNTTFATCLIAKDGSFGGQARRIGVESHGLLPLSPLKINFYAFVLPKEWYTANGVVYTVSRPLLPPPSILDELFLAQHFFILTSALQKVGLDDWLSWEWRKQKDSTTEKGATVTFFAPSDDAFKRLPPKLRRFLFSPFGSEVLKKILSYHIVPDIILHKDYFYNATKTEDDLNAEPQWYEETLHDTAALAFKSPLLKDKCKSRRVDLRGFNEFRERLRRPRFGFPAAGRLPSQKRDGPKSSDEENPILGTPENEPNTGPRDDTKWPHWPPRWPAPAKFHYELPTVLEDGALHVTITKPLPHRHSSSSESLPDPEIQWTPDSTEDVPPGRPAEGKKPKLPLLKSSITVNGQQTRLEAVARNGAVHTIGRLLHPFRTPHHEPSTGPKDSEDDEWADWEDWLPAWAEL